MDKAERVRSHKHVSRFGIGDEVYLSCSNEHRGIIVAIIFRDRGFTEYQVTWGTGTTDWYSKTVIALQKDFTVS